MGEVAAQLPGEEHCEVCRDPSGLKRYCERCRNLLTRKRKGQQPDIAARRAAMRDQWRDDLHAFACKYTGVALTHAGGARNAEWEHVIPGKESSVVLVAALVNRMKADLTEDQWNTMIRALYELRIEGKPFDESAFPLKWQTKATSWKGGE
jgi:hypothetical protein